MLKAVKYFLLTFFVIFIECHSIFAESTGDLDATYSQYNTQELFVRNDINIGFFIPRTHLSTSKVKKHGDNIERRDQDDDEDEVCIHSIKEDVLLDDSDAHLGVEHLAIGRNFHNGLEKGMFRLFDEVNKYLFICSFKI